MSCSCYVFGVQTNDRLIQHFLLKWNSLCCLGNKEEKAILYIFHISGKKKKSEPSHSSSKTKWFYLYHIILFCFVFFFTIVLFIKPLHEDRQYSMDINIKCINC